jgi:hypothetical protein
MSKIEAATKRLEQALARLEAACGRLAVQSDDNERLGAELAARDHEYASLAATTDAVAARLDRALARIDAALGE